MWRQYGLKCDVIMDSNVTAIWSQMWRQYGLKCDGNMDSNVTSLWSQMWRQYGLKYGVIMVSNVAHYGLKCGVLWSQMWRHYGVKRECNMVANVTSIWSQMWMQYGLVPVWRNPLHIKKSPKLKWYLLSIWSKITNYISHHDAKTFLVINLFVVS
jgi:hypothetical protein